MNSNRLPRVDSMTEFSDALQDLIPSESKSTNGNYLRFDKRHRRTQLKTYIIESNSKLESSEFLIYDSIQCEILSTNIDKIKILRITKDDVPNEIYLDISNERFWKLHSNILAEELDKILNYFVNYSELELDHLWYPSTMLYELSMGSGNINNGLKIDYSDYFLKDTLNYDLGELKFRVSGRSSLKAIDTLKKEKDFESSLAYSRMVVKRGNTRKKYIQDDITFHGGFTVKNGSSIEDHLALVDLAENTYSSKIQEIEQSRIGLSGMGKIHSFEGRSFDIEFRRNIEDMDLFTSRLLSSKFRLWGLKSVIQDNLYQISAVDLHTGDPFDLELSNNLLRVYLPKGSCGNVVLRLIVNLQHYFDSNTKCEFLGI